ncbi:MAG: hypothetical protein VKJ64_00655 [Leptolyngbyaceae bacterium]|nr:hypothetical protein [Leptolyngbyaceae bacterium]
MTRLLRLRTLYSVLFRPMASEPGQPYPYGWLALSLGFALWYGLLMLHQAFRADYVVQDDARQHVFWMQRFLDPALFPNDLIADYFQSVAPTGYALVYRLGAWVGVTPLLLHKILPLGLNILTAGLCFRTMLGLFPVPSAAFCSSVVLMQGLGLTDAIVSATPKAFIYPLLLLFMDGVVRQQWWVTWGAIALQGWFYPQLVLISSGTLLLRLVQWQGWRPRLVANGCDRLLCVGGLIVAVLILLPYALQTSEYGPTLTLAEARQWPELSMDGSRSQYFEADPLKYWLEGRSGLRPATIFTPVTNLLGILLLALPWLPAKSFLRQTLNPNYPLLAQLFASSMGCFFLAHLLLFRLHLPSRYTQHSIKIIMTLAASIVLVSLLESLWRWSKLSVGVSGFNTTGDWAKALVSGGLSVLLAIIVVGYSLLVAEFPLATYQYGTYPQLYEFLQSQPSTIRVASLTNEVNNIPTFAQRSIVTGSEYAIPYHVGYYQQLRQRTNELIEAQYSLNQRDIAQFIETYAVTFWLVDQGAFQADYVESDSWIQQHPEAARRALENLQAEAQLPLARARKNCQVLKERNLILLDAGCLIR